MDFKIIENGVVVEENGFHIFVPKHMLDTINNEAQKEWYYKQDVVDYLKEHYNYRLLLSEAPEVIDDLVELYAGLRKINEGCFNWEEYTRRGQNRKCKFKYFDVDFFKKGTAHITFKDDELLKKFNIYGCMKKGWLPPSYGKKSYDEMAEEEKSVVDEFEGANEYSKVFANTENYIVFPESSVKMLNA